MGSEAWLTLFRAAFRDSRNAMCLADDARCVVDVNGACLQLLGYRRADVMDRPMHEFIAGGPLMTPQQWAASLARRRFTGEGTLADELQISLNTVRTHVHNSMKRVGARSRAQLVAKALAEGHALAE